MDAYLQVDPKALTLQPKRKFSPASSSFRTTPCLLRKALHVCPVSNHTEIVLAFKHNKRSTFMDAAKLRFEVWELNGSHGKLIWFLWVLKKNRKRTDFFFRFWRETRRNMGLF
ncbi:hypothetical protein I3843_15G070500 [Carya illinoinensis]|nr:hypothetical protein I3843_15G070500 [Carya illinoinensis]